MTEIASIGARAKAAAARLAVADPASKDAALRAMAAAIEANADAILAANDADLARALDEGVSGAPIDRLTLGPDRVSAMAGGLRELAGLPDPIGEVLESWTRPNGLRITKVRVPMGVVGIIYEGRPNVTADAAGIALKSGNAAVLRGSSLAAASNAAIADVLAQAATAAGMPPDAIQLLRRAGREGAKEMMRAREWIDVLIPRGGADLIRTVVEESTVPVIETGVGNCHVYVDESADPDRALEILVNAKTQRPGVCNAAETLLVHGAIADSFLPRAIESLTMRGVEVRGDERAVAAAAGVVPAVEADWGTEFLDMVMAVKVVGSLDEAIEHVNRYGTRHTEAICTTDDEAARRFVAEVDAACVVVNASTRFADGGEFGFGAEIGISTQKLHARGPMALRELTSYKYVVRGEGQVRA